MTGIIGAVVVVTLSTGAALVAFFVANRLVPLEIRVRHNDVAGFIYAFVGPLYAILLAFVVFVVWGYFDDARTAAAVEATALYKVYSISRGMDSAHMEQFQRLTRAYGESVIKDEWPAMDRGDVQSLKTRHAFVELRDALEAYVPASQRDSDLYQAELSSVEELAGARNSRLLKAEDIVHPALWAALIVGAIVSIGYSFVFGIEHRLSHAFMVAVLAFSISGMLFLIQTLDGPFRGDVKVQPSAMRDTIQIIQGTADPP